MSYSGSGVSETAVHLTGNRIRYAIGVHQVLAEKHAPPCS